MAPNRKNLRTDSKPDESDSEGSNSSPMEAGGDRNGNHNDQANGTGLRMGHGNVDAVPEPQESSFHATEEYERYYAHPVGSGANGLVVIDLEDSASVYQLAADPHPVEAAVPAFFICDNKFWDPDRREEDFIYSQPYRIVLANRLSISKWWDPVATTRTS